MDERTYTSYNFFEPFAKTPPKTNFVNLFVGGIITVLLGVLLAFTGLAYIEKQNLQNEMTSKQQQIDAMDASLNEVTALTEQIQALKSVKEGIVTLTVVQNAIHYGRPDLFRTLGSLMPSQLYLTRVHIASDGLMEIEGVAADSSVVGIFENNLRSAVDKIGGIFVSQYQKVVQEGTGGHYTFSISFIVNNGLIPVAPQAPAEETPEEPSGGQLSA